MATGTIVAFNAANATTGKYADTLKSGDTLFYYVNIAHTTVGYPYLSVLTKLVANDTTSKVTFWQSVDGSSNWQQIQIDSIGVSSPTTLTPITLAKSTTKGTDISFWRKAARFESQYLGWREIASVKSGFKTIYWGSVRFNIAY